MKSGINRLKCALNRALFVVIACLPPIAGAATIEEIIVTAQKREQSLQDVSVSVTAYTGDQVEALGASRAIDLVNYVPNLQVFTIFGEGQQPSFNIRGIGLASFTDSFEPPVAMYVDEIYKGAGVGQTIQMFDLERVEVLRGPQGTLFGRNATGGLIHLITNKPTDETTFRVNTTFGSYDQVAVETVVGGGISDRVRGRVAVRYNSNDGWAHGFFDGVDYNNSDTLGARMMLDFDTSDNSSLLLIASYNKADQNAPALGVTGSLNPANDELCSLNMLRSGVCYSPIGIAFDGVPFSGNSLGGFTPDSVPGQTAASFGVKPEQSVEVSGLSAHMEWQFNAWQLNLIGGYEKTEKYYFEDLVIFSDGFTLDAKQATLEGRASGEYNGSEWLIGVYYFDDEKDMGSFDPTPGYGFTTRGVQDTSSWAIFGQTTVPISDSLSITLGGRYTGEDKSIDYSTDFGIDESRKLETQAFTGRIGLDWQAAENTLVYGSLSTGFKSGGFNGQFVFTPEGLDPVDDEKIATAEIGLKTDFWEHRARFNTSLFYSDYRDIQLGVLIDTPSGGVATQLLNAGNADIYGLEAELSLLPTENFEINASLALIESKVDSDAIVRSGGFLTPIDGNELSATPPVSFSILGRYTYGAFTFQADYSWKDGQWFSTENLETEREDSYGLLNARIGWRSASDQFSVEVFGENLTDEKYFLFLANQASSVVASTWGKPRWYGVKFGYRYR